MASPDSSGILYGWAVKAVASAVSSVEVTAMLTVQTPPPPSCADTSG